MAKFCDAWMILCPRSLYEDICHNKFHILLLFTFYFAPLLSPWTWILPFLSWSTPIIKSPIIKSLISHLIIMLQLFVWASIHLSLTALWSWIPLFPAHWHTFLNWWPTFTTPGFQHCLQQPPSAPLHSVITHCLILTPPFTQPSFNHSVLLDWSLLLEFYMLHFWWFLCDWIYVYTVFSIMTKNS